MARNHSTGLRDSWLSRFAQEHLRVMFYTLGRLSREPAGTVLTAGPACRRC